jgi:serine/threonine protein phosphatase 1
MRKIAISDIHGCVETFRTLLTQQVHLTPDDELYLLGDYVDRGPDSKGVLDHILHLRESGYQVHCLKGNHEEMMYKAAFDSQEVEMWLYNGGKETLMSFGLEDPAALPKRYLDMIQDMDFYFEVDKFILVHAGLNFSGVSAPDKGEEGFLWQVHNPLTDHNSMLWIRWWYDNINWNWLRDRMIIHGHTPIETDEISEMSLALKEDRVLDIDNGCFAKYRDGLGQLCAFDMTHRKLYFQTNVD